MWCLAKSLGIPVSLQVGEHEHTGFKTQLQCCLPKVFGSLFFFVDVVATVQLTILDVLFCFFYLFFLFCFSYFLPVNALSTKKSKRQETDLVNITETS